MIHANEIYQKCLEAGLTPEQIGNHQSDLHVIKNSVTTALVNDYEFKENVKTFKSQIDGAIWYDIPFAYTPFWNDKKNI